MTEQMLYRVDHKIINDDGDVYLKSIKQDDRDGAIQYIILEIEDQCEINPYGLHDIEKNLQTQDSVKIDNLEFSIQELTNA